jgi:hypothetical protein
MIRAKVLCEICGDNNSQILHNHHIRSSNSNMNIAILCPNCHTKVHLGEYIIIGVYHTTDGIMPLWFKKGEEAPLPESCWKIKDNDLVVLSNKE